MCVKCSPNPMQVTVHDVSVKAIGRVWEAKKGIVSVGETITSTEWFIDYYAQEYVGIITYQYLIDGDVHEDFVQVITHIAPYV